jgi:hypothetical protein
MPATAAAADQARKVKPICEAEGWVSPFDTPGGACLWRKGE